MKKNYCDGDDINLEVVEDKVGNDEVH